MWTGKSAARTFFARLFDKKKEKAPDPETTPACRKRSHSMFAPNLDALLSGEEVVGGRGGCSSFLSADPCGQAMINLKESSEARQRLIALVAPVGQLVTTPSPREELSPQDSDTELGQSQETNTGHQQSLEAHNRLNSRRATDFSQADNDLRRFLASRQSKDLPEPGELYSSETSTQDLRKEVHMPVFHKRIYGSVEALEGEERVQRNRRFRVETSEDTEESTEIPPTPVLENPEQQTKWYYKYFLGKLHQNYIGQDSNKNIFILSILQERSYGKYQYRAVLWTGQGPKRLRFRGQDKGTTLKQVLSKFSGMGKLEKLPREVLSPNIQKDILWLEKQEGSLNFKFGVIYAKPGQIMDDELLSNQVASDDFNNFLALLGDRVRLKGFTKYKGGLDVRGDMTGEWSYYTNFEDHEIMYHVSTLLPFSSDDRQQVERKRHIGNDIINIIFVDGSLEEMTRFKPLFIKSQFTHIYAVVCYERERSAYHLSVFSEKSVPLFGPSLPSTPGFKDHQEFRRFLLVKCINGEKATYNTEVFATKRERTFQLLLSDSLELYGGEESRPAKDKMYLADVLPDTSRLYRRKDDGRKDVFVKVGQSLKLENTVSSDLTGAARGSNLRGQGRLQVATRPWDPILVHSSLQIEITTGDSWVGVGLLVAAKEGGWIFRQNGPPEKVLSVSHIVQLNIMESLGIMVFRTERVGKELGVVYVYRLSELETNNKILGREELKEHLIEASRGCSGYSISHREHSGLRLAVMTGRKVLVYSWKHGEEWITFSVDTVEGFELVKEVQCVDTVLVVTLIERAKDEGEEIVMVVGTRRGFEIVDVRCGERREVVTMDCEPADVQELWEDERVELLVTHSGTSLFMREQEGKWGVTREINWNCQPRRVIPAFPYCFAFSADSVEVRSPINGNLLHTLNLPKLNLIACKEDIYFTTTKMINNLRKTSDMEPMSKFCDPLYNIYKISWALVLGTHLNHRSPLASMEKQLASISSESGPSTWSSNDAPSSADTEKTSDPFS